MFILHDLHPEKEGIFHIMFILRGLHPEYGGNIPFQEGSSVF
jgi:hypothetical protein